MPRKTKKTPFSGSQLLGAELRRLRGARTLEEIAMLCKSPPLAGKVSPISASALSEIEVGRQMPRLPTLYSMSLVYRVSMNQLMGFVVEEGIVNAAAKVGEGTPEELRAAFARLLAIGAWHEALPIALHAERKATTERERVGWRANRATCLANIGLHSEAVTMLTACLENPEITRAQEFAVLKNLAEVHAAGGNFKTASSLLRDALEVRPDDLTDSNAGALERLRASLIVDAQEMKAFPEQRALREAIRLADHAEKSCSDEERPLRLRIGCVRARAQHLLGNGLLAARDLERILVEAVDLRYPRMEALAALILGKIRKQAGNSAQAEGLLGRAVSVADASQQNDVLFEACLALFQLLRHDRPGSAVAWLRRCRELAPLLPERSPALREFERVAEEFAT